MHHDRLNKNLNYQLIMVAPLKLKFLALSHCPEMVKFFEKILHIEKT